MVALNAWYDQQGDEPAIRIETTEQLDALIERARSASVNVVAPPMFELSVADNPAQGVVQAGFRDEKGFIFYMVPETKWTGGTEDFTTTVSYDYLGNVQEVPASAEVSAAVTREGLREFFEVAGRLG